MRNSKTRRVTTANYIIVKYVPDWMPGAHFKQVAKETRAVCKRFLDEPFIEVEKRVVNISITDLSCVAYFVQAAGTARRSYVSNLITRLDKSDPTYKQTEWAIKHTAGVLYAGMSLKFRG